MDTTTTNTHTGFFFGIFLDALTVQDCIDLYTYRGQSVIINDGKIVGLTE